MKKTTVMVMTMLIAIMLTSTFNTLIVRVKANTVAASKFGSSSIYGNIIALMDPNDYSLMYYNLSTGSLTDTGIISAFFPEIYGNVIAYPNPDYGWVTPTTYICWYDIYTETESYVLHAQVCNVFDLGLWSDVIPGDIISIYGDIVAFCDYEGIWYFNRSVGAVNNIASGICRGVSIAGNIIAYSENGVIKYLNLTSGIKTDTGVAGTAPCIYCNIITFHDPPTIKYYNISTATVTNTMAIGDWPSIYGDVIAFSTNESYVDSDLNNDGDLDDIVIRYYNKSEGTTTNTGELCGIRCDVEIHGSIITFSTDEVVRYYVYASILGDANHDGYVNVEDLGLLSDAWLSELGEINYDPDCNFNDDNYCNVLDLGIMSDYWLQSSI